MRQLWIVIGIATILVVGEAAASDQVEEAVTAKEEAVTAKKKAVVLEKKIAGGDRKTSPSSAPKINQAEAHAVDPVGKGALNNAITCLSRTIYWEARGDGTAGMEAIANVVINRVGHKGFPDTVCKVVKEGRRDGVCQFTWWCHRRSDATDEKSYSLAKEISRKALNRQLPDRTHGALYFHQRTVTPAWSKKYIRTVAIGQLVFYKPRGTSAR